MGLDGSLLPTEFVLAADGRTQHPASTLILLSENPSGASSCLRSDFSFHCSCSVHVYFSPGTTGSAYRRCHPHVIWSIAGGQF